MFDPTPLTTADLTSMFRADEARRLWAQRAVFGRVGPVGTSSGPVDDAAFSADLRARLTETGGAA